MRTRPAPSTERRAHSELARPRDTAREQQIGEVPACHREHDSDDRTEDQENGADLFAFRGPETHTRQDADRIA
jgi:hypothetical protein